MSHQQGALDVACIQESIQEKKNKFDFLKGNEDYKHHLGGKEISLYNCQISLEGE